MIKEHTNVALVTVMTPCNQFEEINDEAIYATWTKMTNGYPDEYDSEPMTVREYCKYVKDII